MTANWAGRAATVVLAMELKRFEPAPWWNAPKAPSVM